jgi:hypothetical protein
MNIKYGYSSLNFYEKEQLNIENAPFRINHQNA